MGKEEELLKAARTAFIDAEAESKGRYRPRLVYNDQRQKRTVLSDLETALSSCKEFLFSVAFITSGGLEMLLQTFVELKEKGVKGRIITTDYLNFSEPKALRKLLEFDNISVRVAEGISLHTKGYGFLYDDELYSIMIGSANITSDALKCNREWNVMSSSLRDGEFTKSFLSEFKTLWDDSAELTPSWIDCYEKRWKALKREQAEPTSFTLTPNYMQEVAIKALSELRRQGKKKALLIAATGTGKTYLSAFDVARFKPRRMLFLVHREQILDDAAESFAEVLGKEINEETGRISGGRKEKNKRYTFATVQTFSKSEVFQAFPPDYFDYIIIDEVHKAGAMTYQRIINYFKPEFLLGMSATPDRTDQNRTEDGIERNIYKLFDYNIACEIRLNQAMEYDLLCPFHYFGITDITAGGKALDEETDFNLLTSDERVGHIIEKANLYGFSGDRVKGLIFCSRNEEASLLSEKLNKRGLRTIALSGSDSPFAREKAVTRLEMNEGKEALDYILTVDIFNEGIDIPSVNQVIMLRPTLSSIIFIQQLGRGLRKDRGKEYLVVIDFISNYKKNYLIPIALSGDQSYDKDRGRRYAARPEITGSSTVSFDRISRERIYKSIDSANFNATSLIRAEYETLRAKLGRIPELLDFTKYETIDIFRIIDKFGSYYTFLKKYEDEYTLSLTKEEEEIVCFVSQKIAKGKRLSDLLALKAAIDEENDVLSVAENELKFDYCKAIGKEELDSVRACLTNRFAQTSMQKKYKNCVFIKEKNRGWQTDDKFSLMLKRNPDFKTMLEDLIKLGIRRYNDVYKDTYEDTEFTLYEKYTYEDVTRLLNWKQDVSAQIIGGYCFNKDTMTMPVFINYDKRGDDAILYRDRFLDPETLIALSKTRRGAESEDAKKIYGGKYKIYLFMRKNKDDGTKEFYFLGLVKATGAPLETTQADGSKVFEITYKLKTPVREDIYQYLISNIDYEDIV